MVGHMGGAHCPPPSRYRQRDIRAVALSLPFVSERRGRMVGTFSHETGTSLLRKRLRRHDCWARNFRDHRSVSEPPMQQPNLAVKAALPMKPTRIAIFDHVFRRSNPVGSCQRRVASSLLQEHEITVFAASSDITGEEHLRYVRVPAVRRPLVLLYVTYHVVAFLRLVIEWIRGRRFALTISSDSYFSIAPVRYAHFCHRAFLRLQPWPPIFTSLRAWFNWLDHLLQAAVEPFAFRGARTIVACSRGLAREILREYPSCRGKISVIPNAIETDRLRRPEDFQRKVARERLGFSETDVVLAFVALGHFERKGVPILIEAVALARNPQIKLLVVGGDAGTLAAYRRQATDRGVMRQVHFAGRQSDVRPMLWAADAFAFPSHYEAFPLAALEAAAAGLPLIASRINGIEEILVDGENGYVITHSPESLAKALMTFAALGAEERQRMGAAARRAVEPFNPARFALEWREVIRLAMNAGSGGSVANVDGGVSGRSSNYARD